ncbi:MAG: 7-cyano-7-deazaguanine synthase [Candidatus Anoxymicrobium japonicum]|uniref:7-cyano-7-deazaguanine synthase n=1 Tax=Candidatus Anoxymicrobium japonicum TaxID=2013648 RepID=A0A2N3G8G5_9ACTN|nr:MAG: 7-cyano-7-deazaguanine synthase [Candidatus Anoxymicrobium japonicum]
MKKALVLVSGGMDSGLCLYLAVAEHGQQAVDALFFDWGQRALKEELAAARAICRETGVDEPLVVTLDFPYRGPLTDQSIALQIDRSPSEMQTPGISAAFFPGRNLVMLAHAFGLASSRGHSEISFGPNADDAAGYPDCREKCLRNLEVACRCGLEREIALVLPVIHMSKLDIVRVGNALGVPWDMTFSCYSPVDGAPCKRCDACVLRADVLKHFSSPADGED